MDGDSKAFAAMDMSFSTPSAAGHEVLLSNRYRRVTAENRAEYVRLALNFRNGPYFVKKIPVPVLCYDIPMTSRYFYRWDNGRYFNEWFLFGLYRYFYVPYFFVWGQNVQFYYFFM